MGSSYTVPLPAPVVVNGVEHESVTITDSIDIDLSTPIEVNGEMRARLAIRLVRRDEWKRIHATIFTNEKRGIALCQAATGLPRQSVLQLEQPDIEAVFKAMFDLRERFAALAPILDRV